MLGGLLSSSQSEVDKIVIEGHSIVAGVGIGILQDRISLRLTRNYLVMLL